MARPGTVRRSGARRGRHGLAWWVRRGPVRWGMSRLGRLRRVRYGAVVQGGAGFGRRVWASYGKARLVQSRFGQVRQARFGRACSDALRLGPATLAGNYYV
jgi:hypothetical protein